MTGDPAWRAEANCLGLDPDLFYPEESGSAEPQTRAIAYVCGACPVRAQCLEYALERREQWGWWGGHSPRDRRRLLRSRRSAA